jgi:hypothetical protein
VTVGVGVGVSVVVGVGVGDGDGVSDGSGPGGGSVVGEGEITSGLFPVPKATLYATDDESGSAPGSNGKDAGDEYGSIHYRPQMKRPRTSAPVKVRANAVTPTKTLDAGGVTD